jgi:hypothetical protein
MKKLICLLFVFCLAPLLYARDAEPPDTLSRLSLSIREQLSGLKTQTEVLRNSLTALREDLTISESKREEYKTLSENLNISLTSMSEKQSELYGDLEKYKEQLSRARKIILAMAVVCGIFIALKIIAITLRLKFGFRLPWIIDVLV